MKWHTEVQSSSYKIRALKIFAWDVLHLFESHEAYLLNLLPMSDWTNHLTSATYSYLCNGKKKYLGPSFAKSNVQKISRVGF